MDADVPTADALTSTGDAVATPEYSCTYTMPNEVSAVANVALTVFAPPAMFEA
jgi:hypothetical protein